MASKQPPKYYTVALFEKRVVDGRTEYIGTWHPVPLVIVKSDRPGVDIELCVPADKWTPAMGPPK